MASYRLTRAADIFVAGIELIGLEQADRYRNGIAAAFEFLAGYPRAARLRTEIVPPVRADPYKAHLIVYDLDADGVVILRVRHGREDWMDGG